MTDAKRTQGRVHDDGGRGPGAGRDLPQGGWRSAIERAEKAAFALSQERSSQATQEAREAIEDLCAALRQAGAVGEG